MLFGAVLSGCGLLLPYFRQHIAALYFSAAILDTGFVFYNLSVQNLTGAWGSREARAKNFSMLSLGYSQSSLLGPLAAGYNHRQGHRDIPVIAVGVRYRLVGEVKIDSRRDCA